MDVIPNDQYILELILLFWAIGVLVNHHYASAKHIWCLFLCGDIFDS